MVMSPDTRFASSSAISCFLWPLSSCIRGELAIEENLDRPRRWIGSSELLWASGCWTNEVHLALDAVQQVAHLFLLGPQVRGRNLVDAWLAGNSLHDFDAGFFQLANFLRVVGQEADLFRAELFEDLSGKVIFARIRGKAQLLVGFHSVHPAILQFVSAELVHQADAAAFLREIE